MEGEEDEAHLQRAGWATFGMQRSHLAVLPVLPVAPSPCRAREKCMLRVMNEEIGENTSQGN